MAGFIAGFIRVAVALWLLTLAAQFAGAQVTHVQALEGGVALFEQQRYAEAKARLQRVAESHPEDARAAYYLGRIALMEGNAKEGAQWLERATKADPESARYFRWLGRAYAREALRANKLRGAMLAGRVRGALERAVALDPANIDARTELMQFYLAVPGIVGGSVSKAKEQAAEIAGLNGYRGRIAEGMIAEREDRDEAAREAYQSAIEEYPDSAAAYYALGALHRRAGAFADAVATYRTLLERQPRERAAYYHIGRTGSLSGEHLDEAAAALRRYLDSPPRDDDPSLASAHYRLGIVYERMGDTTQARREYATTLRLDPSQKDARHAMKRLP